MRCCQQQLHVYVFVLCRAWFLFAYMTIFLFLFCCDLIVGLGYHWGNCSWWVALCCGLLFWLIFCWLWFEGIQYHCDPSVTTGLYDQTVGGWEKTETHKLSAGSDVGPCYLSRGLPSAGSYSEALALFPRLVRGGLGSQFATL
jgi:hypothetical protein